MSTERAGVRMGDNSESDEPIRPGRKRKFTLERARELMVEASIDQLLRNGVSAGLHAVRLDRVLVISEVPRGSAYKAWEHPERSPQENLQHAVVLHILEKTTANNAQPTQELALRIIAELEADINSGDVDRMRSARSEVARQVAVFNHDLLNSDMWKLYRALVLIASTQPSPDREIVAAIERGEDRLITAYTDLFDQFAEIFTMTLKPGTTSKQFAMALFALNDGLANHDTLAFDQSAPIITPDGREWTLFGYACNALLDAFYDIKP